MNGRCLREAGGWSRRRADIADRGLVTRAAATHNTRVKLCEGWIDLLVSWRGAQSSPKCHSVKSMKFVALTVFLPIRFHRYQSNLDLSLLGQVE